jgi:NADH dehydrogenase
MPERAAPTREVLVLGAGFGGLFTALDTYRRLRRRAGITLVDRHDHFLFTPLLYQVTSGSLAPDHVARPLARLLPAGIRRVQATVTGIDLDARRVHTDAGGLAYDFLVIALGGVPHFHGLASVEQHALTFKSVSDALRLRAHIEQRFAEAARDPALGPDLLRTVVVGAGCTGVELAAELHDWMYGTLLGRFPVVGREAVGVVLAEALDHLLCPMDPILMRAALRKLVTRTIKVLLAHHVTGVGPGWVRIRTGPADEEQIPCGTVVWTAGIRPNPVTARLPVATGPGGRIPVDASLRVTGYPEVLAVGDAALSLEPNGQAVPATAQAAVQQAAAAGGVLQALVDGTAPRPFVYRRKGEVLGLGRLGALAEAFGLRFMGLPGWLIARAVHLARLPDWGDRVAVAWESARDLIGAPADRRSAAS